MAQKGVVLTLYSCSVFLEDTFPDNFASGFIRLPSMMNDRAGTFSVDFYYLTRVPSDLLLSWAPVVAPSLNQLSGGSRQVAKPQSLFPACKSNVHNGTCI